MNSTSLKCPLALRLYKRSTTSSLRARTFTRSNCALETNSLQVVETKIKMNETEMFFNCRQLSNKELQTIINQINLEDGLETRLFPELSDDQGGEGSSAPRQLQAGVILANRYAIQEVVGLGGMGSVYRSEEHTSELQSHSFIS